MVGEASQEEVSLRTFSPVALANGNNSRACASIGSWPSVWAQDWSRFSRPAVLAEVYELCKVLCVGGTGTSWIP